MSASWLVVGFTCDDVVGAGQHWRLAEECVRAWRAAGSSPDFQILEATGDGDHILHWFVNDVAARVLDERVGGWRDRVLGASGTLPDATSDPLKQSTA
jgi:hypothetical protein